MRRAKCLNSTNNNPHKQFIVGAIVREEWIVDEKGNYLSVFESQVIEGPQWDEYWTCSVCGEQAVIVDE